MIDPTSPTLFPDHQNPATRNTDPPTSHQAAARSKPGSAELVALICAYVEAHPHVTAFAIADALAGDRWDEGTVRTAVSRAPLRHGPKNGRSPRGLPCRTFTIDRPGR